MIRAAVAIALAASDAAHACGNEGDAVARGAQYAIAFRTAPSPVRMGEHFALDLAVCPMGNAPMPREVRVDASMPEHRHGMNYKPSVVAKGTGRYRAEGLLFHMGGHWQIAFDVIAPGATERITASMDLP